MNIETLNIFPFDWWGVFVSLVCASIIGLERQLRGKPVGIRTASLIVLGTYVFVSIGMHEELGAVEQGRIIGQVITGIGFLGAGVMLARDGAVVGVTSAATIWMLAAIGITIAKSHFLAAFLLSVVVVLVLVGVDLLESKTMLLTKGVHQKYSNWRSRKKSDL